MSEAENETQKAPAAPPPRGFPRVLDWLSVSRELDFARGRELPSRTEREFLAKAIETARLGDHLLDPADGGPRQPDFALTLLRQADYYLSRIEHARSREDSPELPEPLSFADAPLSERLRAAEAAQRAVERRIDRVLREREPVPRLLLQRTLRRALLGGAAVAVCAGLVFSYHALFASPDWADGRPYRTSSTLYECDPDRGACGGAPTKIFFHTKEQDEPWLEIDLERLRNVGSVEVRNRTDHSSDRAVPLVIELSADGESYETVAERAEPFTDWVATFEARPARFVRLTVRKRTIFHLERVAVRK